MRLETINTKRKIKKKQLEQEKEQKEDKYKFI